MKSGVQQMTVETSLKAVEARSVTAPELGRQPEPEAPATSMDEALRLAELSVPEQRRSLRKHSELSNPQVVVSLCRRAAGLLRMDLPQARRMVEAAGSVAEALGDSISSARAERARAQLHHIQAEYRTALEGYANSVAHYEAVGEEVQAAITRSCALHVLAILGRFEMAESWTEQSRELFTRMGDRVRLARLDANAAVVLHRRHEFEQALRLSLRAYERLRAQGTAQDVAVTLRNILVCHVGLRNITMALDTYDRARAFCDRHRFPRLVLEADYNIAYVHQMTGDYEQSIHLYERTRASFREWGDSFHEALCDLDQSEAYLDIGETDEAEALARKALGAFEELGVAQEIGRARIHLAIVAGSRGLETESLELLEDARRVFEECGDPIWGRLTEFYRALVLDQCGEAPRALEVAGAARDASERDASPVRRALFENLVAYLHAGPESGDVGRRASRQALKQLTGIAGVPKMPAPGWLLPGFDGRKGAAV